MVYNISISCTFIDHIVRPRRCRLRCLCAIRMLVWINTVLSRTRPGANYSVIYMDAYVYATIHRRLLS